MSRRLSSIFTSGVDKPLPTMPASGNASPASPRRHSPPDDSRSRSEAPGRLRKAAPAPSGSHARAASGQYLAPDREPTLPNLPSLQDLQYSSSGAPSPLRPPPPIAAPGSGYNSRSSSVERSRPSTPQQNYSRPSTPNALQVPGGGRPMTPTSLAGGDGPEKKEKKHHSFFGRSKKDTSQEPGPVAWVSGHPQRQAYDTSSLLQGRPIPELWDDSAEGNCYVYLFPRGSDRGKGASFKIDSAIFAASPVLTRLAFGDAYNERRQMPLDARMQGLGMHDTQGAHTPPMTPEWKANTMTSMSSNDSRNRFSSLSDASGAQETHLYLPIRLSSSEPSPAAPQVKSKKEASIPDPALGDLQTLLDIRNFFAFLQGQSLIATAQKGSWFQIFMSIAGILKTYEFANLDGSTYGEVASSSFDAYVEEVGLADVRGSREKTIEGIVLGERMKSIMLYNEAFTHAVGKHEDLVGMKSPKFSLISPITQNRLTRAAMDLEKREASIKIILKDFEFPFLFSGIMNSKMSEERKEGVRFDGWKDAWFGMRKWTLGTLTHRYGHWPPKAKSKKNDLETSGLNRAVLKSVYEDMSSLYDLLVDRSNLTTRTVDGIDRNAELREEATVRALRAVLSEYDRSSPPVKPPVPFDLPLLPDLRTTRPDFGRGDKKKDLKAIGKKLKDDEIAALLSSAHNNKSSPGGGVQRTPFLDAFLDMEKRAAHGCTIAELVDLRIGQWVFMYVVLQALPMLACDAPSIKWTKGVEYFLCEPPRSGVPWANPSATAAAAGIGGRRWFSVGEGGGVVQLPSDVVEHGVEGIYRRSHCWVMAERWSSTNPILNSALHEQEQINAEQSAALGDGLPPPPLPSQGFDGRPSSRPPSRPGSSHGGLAPGGSPMRNPNRMSSLGIGLEALPLPMGVTPDGRSSSPAGSVDGRPRSVHTVDSSKTFDAILGEVPGQKKGKKK